MKTVIAASVYGLATANESRHAAVCRKSQPLLMHPQILGILSYPFSQMSGEHQTLMLAQHAHLATSRNSSDTV
jgi:hypothetical protein